LTLYPQSSAVRNLLLSTSMIEADFKETPVERKEHRKTRLPSIHW